ncbi:uncharacterized protein LOC112158356 [Oryzias melastigma]|uniref:uncharacterized protein LOC112158356 n=1 Tax=Oryzias melastigma TaxID=30732 RepID=UPI00168D8718|nr:uncharacterized protein LOC112158356 [Oryzias melastigma]
MNIYLQKEISKDRMTLCLELFIIFMLLSGGISIKTEHLYKRVGEDVSFHCGVDRSSNQCSDVQWLYNRDGQSGTINKAKTPENSPIQASRLSVSRNCSLTIRNINDEDAGRYNCRIGNNDALVYLNILNISSSDVDGRVDLTCSMKSFYDYFCEQNSFIWMDETRTELSDKNSEFEVKKQTNCDSVLTVKHQSKNIQRFTCQIVEDKKVKIEAVYVLTGKGGQTEHLYHRVGDDVALHCRDKSSSSSCSDVNWLYQKDPNAQFRTEVQNGKVVQSSAGVSRLSVSSNCSLFIRNITDEDVGGYICQLKNKNDAHLVLNALSISSDPPEVHPRENGSFTLLCSLNRYDKRIPCKENSIIWRDERGSHLIGEGVWFEFRGQTNCVSVLTVKHQSGNNKRFTCRFLEDNKVKIKAVYSLNVSDPTQSNPVINPAINPVVIIGAVVGVVLVLLVIFAVLLFRTKRAKTTKDHNGGKEFQMPTYQNNEPDSGPESELTYAAVNHSRSKATSKITIKEEEGEVTYSTVKRN